MLILGTPSPFGSEFRDWWNEFDPETGIKPIDSEQWRKKAEKPYYNLLNNTARLDEETGRIVLRTLYKEELDALEESNHELDKETN